MGPLEWIEEAARTLWQVLFMLVMGPYEMAKTEFESFFDRLQPFDVGTIVPEAEEHAEAAA